MNEIRFRLRIFLAITVGVVAIGVLGLMYSEGLGFGEALYFSIVTLTTVGYGDISPHTAVGRFFAVVMIIAGVGAFMGVVANVTEMFLSRREQSIRQSKTHMVASVFFSELGGELLRLCAAADDNPDELKQCIGVDKGWGKDEFQALRRTMINRGFSVDINKIKLAEVRKLLGTNGDFLLRLLENPYLLESEKFSAVLLAVFHLRDELNHRQVLDALPQSDLAHLSADISRVYRLLTEQWLSYAQYLAENYPYLFFMAVRANPFCLGPVDVVVRN